MNENTTVKSTTIRDLVIPLKILISPLKTFSQLAQKPSLKGLLSLSALILVVTAAAQYASATKIDLKINEQRTSFVITDAFGGWFATRLASTALGILLYWLVFASGLALISKIFGGKETSWRVLLVVLAYLLSVFIILYAVRAVIYLVLPSLYFNELSYWPPNPENETDWNFALNLIDQSWGPLAVYQFDVVFAFVVLAWLGVLGAVAVKVLREVSWERATAVSAIGIIFTFLVWRLP